MNPTETAKQVLADPAAQYQALIRSLRRRKGFGILFVQATPARGTRLIDEVRADLPQKNVAVLTLEEPITNLFKLIQARPDQDTLDILFIRGIEKSFDDYIKPGYGGEGDYYKLDTIPPILSHLNQQRDQFRDTFKFCLVFLVPRYALKYFIQRAPDFFDWRSGIVELHLDSKELQSEYFQSLLNGVSQDYESLDPQQRSNRILTIQDLLNESQHDPDQRASLWFELALLLQTDHRYEEAIAAYDNTLATQPDKHRALNNKGIALRNLGQYETAIATYDVALAIKPDDHELLYNKGNALGDLYQYEAAIAAYDAALVIQPNYYQAFYNKGNALQNLGQYEAAIAAYDAALAINPDDHELFYNKGGALWNLGQYEAAIAAYDAALAIQPNLHEALNNKGRALRNLGQYEAEIAAYDAALAIKPDYHKALNNKGNVLRDLGQYEAAISAYDAALAIKPDNHQALNNKGVALDKLGQYEAAIVAYDAALAIKPDYHQALDNKGVTFNYLGQYEEALAAFNLALSIRPNCASTLYNRACCYGLQHKLNLAIADLKAAIDLDAKYREMAKTDTDFDAIRDNERFQQLLSESQE